MKSLGSLNGVELVGSWTVNVGDQDQALHLWKFHGGYETIDTYSNIVAENEVKINLMKFHFALFDIL